MENVKIADEAVCVESFVEVCEYCVVVVSLKVRFEQVELCITLKWTGHKELDYCKKGWV